MKIKSRVQLIRINNNVYYWLLNNNPNILDKHLPRTRKTWTKELAKKEALKYKKRADFKKNSNGCYQYALKNGILDEICKYMDKRGVWDFTLAKKEALKYKTRADFKKNSGGCYMYAFNNGILDEICKHMGNPVSGVSKKVINLDTKEIYDSLTAASKKMKMANISNLYNSIRKGTKCGGYRWAYCDEKGRPINVRKAKN